MEAATMGKTLVKARITNLGDWINAKAGSLRPEQVRFVEVDDALVNTGPKFLSLPRKMIQQLGLGPVATRSATTAAGDGPGKVYYPVLLEIQGRELTLDVTEVPDTYPVLIGHLALEAMDFVIDPAKQQVIGNPAHGGREIIELY
jgi:predicted aspartyl protease